MPRKKPRRLFANTQNPHQKNGKNTHKWGRGFERIMQMISATPRTVRLGNLRVRSCGELGVFWEKTRVAKKSLRKKIVAAVQVAEARYINILSPSRSNISTSHLHMDLVMTLMCYPQKRSFLFTHFGSFWLLQCLIKMATLFRNAPSP